MTWFEELTGFPERDGDQVREGLRLDGTRFTSLANQRTFEAGRFATPSLHELRRTSLANASFDARTGNGCRLTVKELVGDVRSLHNDVTNENAVFQVASQFNCLEMAAPHICPEDGVGIYQNDWTQGPACSICCGAGTIYRNYFANVNGRMGQTKSNQIDCLFDVGRHLGRDVWRMQNGYCFPSSSGLAYIENLFSKCNEQALDNIRGKLRVGVQSKTQVTIGDATHLVTQVFCSALPISYSDIAASAWDLFPRLILDSTYEATFHVAVQNMSGTDCNKLYLTLVGGGVFGNRLDWILSSISRSLELFAWANLDVFIVSHGSSKPELVSFLAQQNG